MENLPPVHSSVASAVHTRSIGCVRASMGRHIVIISSIRDQFDDYFVALIAGGRVERHISPSSVAGESI